MKSTTKTAAVGNRPAAKTAKAEPKKGGKKADFSMMDEIRKEEQRAADAMAGVMTKEVFDKVIADDSNDQTSVEYVPPVTVAPELTTPAGITLVKKKKRGAGIEPALHPHETVTNQIEASIKNDAAPVPVAAPSVENKRITPGTEIKEWRVVKSLRAEFNGWFLQGGTFKRGPRGNQFYVGIEERYLDSKAAREALKGKVA